MIEKEEKLTLEEQRINELLSENFDKSEWIKRGLTPNSFPPEFAEDCISLDEFNQNANIIIKEIMKEKYGYIVD